MLNLLVVEPEAEINRGICAYLDDSGFLVSGYRTEDDALRELQENRYDLIVADCAPAQPEKPDFAEALRRVSPHIPMLFLFSRENLPAEPKEFRLGLDDYMGKPLDLEEMVLRIRVLLRRTNQGMERKIIVGNLLLDADALSARINGAEVALTAREFYLIYKLLSYPNKTFSRAQLMDEFWGVGTETGLRAVDIYVSKLRSKLSACNGFTLNTVRGLGYKAVLT